jgi:AcrR family transcriptional regulator
MATATILDGRTRRRLANRDRILDASIALVADGSDVSVESIAAHAEVSVRSVYNHFPTERDLVAGMYERGAEKVRPLLAYLPDPTDPLPERIRRWVAVWARIQEDIAPIRWRALIAEVEHPGLQPELAKLRAAHRAEVTRMFPELCDEQARRAVVAITDSLAWRAMRRHQGLTFEEASSVVEDTITRGVRT